MAVAAKKTETGKWGSSPAPCPEVPNGIFTLEKQDGTGRRTFRFETQATEGNTFFPGQRTLSVLVGPDPSNYRDWKSLGRFFHGPNGAEVRVWKSVQGTAFEAQATFAVNAVARFSAGKPVQGLNILAACTCLRCNRALTVPASIRAAYGPDCAEILGVDYGGEIPQGETPSQGPVTPLDVDQTPGGMNPPALPGQGLRTPDNATRALREEYRQERTQGKTWQEKRAQAPALRQAMALLVTPAEAEQARSKYTAPAPGSFEELAQHPWETEAFRQEVAAFDLF
ncbi:MAG: DUF6011 domain-containing protein [Syntrophobacterales bacterium]|jgi:hypothetical protein|nr:DUF6011 domain-containing protein [Syntrophobacterales bacterium]